MTRGAIRVRNRPHQSAIESASVENKQVSNAQRFGRRFDLARHLDVVARRLEIARGMAVQHATVSGTALI